MEQKTNLSHNLHIYFDIIYLLILILSIAYGASKNIGPLDDYEINDCISIGNNIYFNQDYTYKNLEHDFLAYRYIIDISSENITVSKKYRDTKVVLSKNENNQLVSDIK